MPKTYPPTLYVNDFDLGRLGIALTNPAGLRDAVGSADATTALPGGGLGAAITSLRPARPARPLRLEFLVAGDTRDAARASLRELAYRTDPASGVTRLRLFDDPARELVARRQALGATPAVKDLSAYDVASEWVCVDPQWYDRAPLALGPVAPGVQLALPLGSGRSAPTLTVYGPATAPVVTYRHADGTALARLAFSAAMVLGPGEGLVIDLTRAAASVSGVNRIGDLTPDSRFFTCLSGVHGDYLLERWPTVETSAGRLAVAYPRGWVL